MVTKALRWRWHEHMLCALYRQIRLGDALVVMRVPRRGHSVSRSRGCISVGGDNGRQPQSKDAANARVLDAMIAGLRTALHNSALSYAKTHRACSTISQRKFQSRLLMLRRNGGTEARFIVASHEEPLQSLVIDGKNDRQNKKAGKKRQG
jgi:hypothetical protein